MTYLELINKVLRRIREPVVGTPSENAYSALVGEFVNDAKRVVEDAWAWRALVDQVQVVTVNGTQGYSLSNFNCALSGDPPRENARLYREPESGVPLIKITSTGNETFLKTQSPSYKFIEIQQHLNEGLVDRPDSVIFATDPTAASGSSNLKALFVPTPNAAYNVSIYVVNAQNDLADGSEVLLVPSLPVVQLAYLYCLYERGEEIGEALTLTSNKADAALADAIMFDSSQTSELIFTPD